MAYTKHFELDTGTSYLLGISPLPCILYVDSTACHRRIAEDRTKGNRKEVASAIGDFITDKRGRALRLRVQRSHVSIPVMTLYVCTICPDGVHQPGQCRDPKLR
jgi:hypothetical protein